ncbi:MAG: tRNA 2-thiouridine(34) synthase MnmA [Deltaproteobacteria bacterium]|nr:tRNA 2-thiouridine(34) synthase MnmA [Deltaproteobacteria bacterium]
MSGGVDSGVAAARLVDAGFEVVGVTLHLWDYPDDAPEKSRCCAPEDAHDARLVADHLGIPHYTFDRRELFARDVVAPFVSAYLEGTTPSPCVWCNRTVKMHELFGLAARLGAVAIATGHYARVVRDAGGTPRLHAGRDPRKDQSYFLHTLGRSELERLLLPLGDATKDEVRSEALRRDLPGADKGESQELCFVPTGEYAAFVEERAGGRVRPGPIVDGTGRVVGSHAGLHRYTVGQRRGLGVALGKPAFVTAIDPTRDAVVVGDEACSSRASLVDGIWSDDVRFPLRAEVKVRSHHRPQSATIAEEGPPGSGRWTVAFDEPARAVAPGQVAVAYVGDRVLGGATIALFEGTGS